MTDWAEARLSQLGTVTLGKMIQPNGAEGSIDLPYVRAAHIQPRGRWHDATSKKMPFSPSEVEDLDIRRDDVLIVEGGAGFGRSHRVSDDMPGWGFQNSIVRFRPRRGTTDGRFVAYALQAALETGRIALETSVATIPHFTAEKVSAFRVQVPDIDTQVDVADFLDREAAKIDALIAKQDALDGVVRERLRSVQDSLVSLSTDGVRLKYLLEEIDLRAGPDCERLPLLSVSIHWGVRRRDEVTDDPPRADDLANYKAVRSGDIVVNRMRAFQGALGMSPIDGMVSPDYLVLRATRAVRPDWLAAAMRTPEFVSEMAARVRGIGSADLGTVRTPRINLDALGDIRLDVPTFAEQGKRYGARQRSESQAAVLLERIGRLTDALKERRAALITAAVTGRLDVTTYGKAG